MLVLILIPVFAAAVLALVIGCRKLEGSPRER